MKALTFLLPKKIIVKLKHKIKLVSMCLVKKIKQLILFIYQAKNLMIVLVYC